jgi:hypothetical protein
LTRGLAALAHGNFAGACRFNVITMPIALMLLLELLLRITLIRAGARRDIPQRIIQLDLWTHAILLTAYVVYALAFVIANV